jgi:hypothetical protein
MRKCTSPLPFQGRQAGGKPQAGARFPMAPVDPGEPGEGGEVSGGGPARPCGSATQAQTIANEGGDCWQPWSHRPIGRGSSV